MNLPLVTVTSQERSVTAFCRFKFVITELGR